MAKKRGKGTKQVPRKGDPDFLTPTQLRNRRKRRAKKKPRRHEGKRSQLHGAPAREATSGTNGDKSPDGHSARSSNEDPSVKYLSKPMKAPVVQEAKRYFESISRGQGPAEFRVHVGPLRGWRTVSKLAVRPDKDGRLAIGLFLPQSHALLPVPNSPTHHPSINRAVECITSACHEVGVVPYRENGKAEVVSGNADADDDSFHGGEDGSARDGENHNYGADRGTGQLRYVSVNVARETGAVQITLVWNTPPPREERGQESIKRMGVVSIDDPVLRVLVTKLIAMSTCNGDDDPVVNGDGKLSNDGAKSTDDQLAKKRPTKKRRQKGRQDRKPDKEHGSNNTGTQAAKSGRNDDGAGVDAKEASSYEADKHKKGMELPKLNLHSLWINYNPSWTHSNAIFSYDHLCWKHVHGPRAIVEYLSLGKARKRKRPNHHDDANDDGGRIPPLTISCSPEFPIPLTFPPNVFRQANLDAFSNIIRRIRERIRKLGQDKEGDNGDGITCVELYGGVGTIGLHLSDVISSLVSSDENPNNAQCFYESAHALPPRVRARLSYVKKNAADMVEAGAAEGALLWGCKALVVDPPRRGLDAEVVDYLCGEGCGESLELVVYVSCGFRAFRRDCDALTGSGQWRVESVEGHLLFPGSDAIETLAFFVRA